MKYRSPEIEMQYKTYKHLFETIKTKSKKLYYSQKLIQHKDNIRKTWRVMKEIIGKTKVFHSNFPQKVKENEVNIVDKEKIASAFNQFFINIGPDLAKKIPESTEDYASFVKKVETNLPSKALSINELKEAFYSLKINKSAGHDDIDFHVVKQCFGELSRPLKYLFDLSLQKGIFPNKMKIAKVTPIYKSGDTESLGNYRPISVLPCFSKILERIMYNRLYKFLTENNILYEKQFGFIKRAFNRTCNSAVSRPNT